MSSKQLRELSHSVFESAHSGSVEFAELKSLRGLLEGELERDGADVTRDDVEWFILYEHVLDELRSSSKGSDFGLPTEDWRTLGIQFEKLRKFYDTLERTGAVENVSWYLGGNADVRCLDLRPVEDYLNRQIQLRLRRMGLDPGDHEHEGFLHPTADWFKEHRNELIVGILLILVGIILERSVGLLA